MKKAKEIFVRLGVKDLIISKEDFHNHKYGTDCTCYFIGYEDECGNECEEDGTYLNPYLNQNKDEDGNEVFSK
jgi:hypothetical protein